MASHERSSRRRAAPGLAVALVAALSAAAARQELPAPAPGGAATSATVWSSALLPMKWTCFLSGAARCTSRTSCPS